MDTKPIQPRVIAGKGVWLESEAERQLATVATLPDCTAAVGMPDLHPGPGIPIGAAFAFGNTVHPHLVGSDAGCGALVVALGKHKIKSTLEKRVREVFDAPAFDETLAASLGPAAWSRGARGLMGFDLPAVIEHLASRLAAQSAIAEAPAPASEAIGELAAMALGSIGGGNHFVELGRVTRIVDLEAADELGLHKGSLVLLCHSGSRGLGKMLADTWGHQALPAKDAQAYLDELAGALRFAQANRLAIVARMLRALGISRPSGIASAFDIIHNTVASECVCGSEMQWVHRKGCAPAHHGQTTVVLGSRGTPSWILRGLGNPAGLSSVAHGAGRKMRRSEARDKLRARYSKRELRGGKQGILICDDKKLVYEEHPDVYKDIEPVVASLEAAELATRIAAIEPILTVKK